MGRPSHRLSEHEVEPSGTTIRSGQAACALSIIRNAIINYFRACGVERIAAEFRANVLKIDLLLTKLGLFNL